MRELKVLVWNIVFGALIYYGLLEKIDGAYNVLIFLIWLLFVNACAMATNDGQNFVIKSNKHRSKIAILYNYVDIAAVGIFVWFGHWFLAILTILSMILIEYGWDKISKKRS